MSLEKIARDIAAGTFPKKSEETLREEAKDNLLQRARAMLTSADTITYPSISAAREVREIVRDLLAVAELSDQIEAMAIRPASAVGTTCESAKLADDLDRLKHLEQTTADGEPDNMGESWHNYAQEFIDNHDMIVAALRVPVPSPAPSREALAGTTTRDQRIHKIYQLISDWYAINSGATAGMRMIELASKIDAALAAQPAPAGENAVERAARDIYDVSKAAIEPGLGLKLCPFEELPERDRKLHMDYARAALGPFLAKER